MTRVLFAPRDLPPLGPDVSGDLPRYRAWVETQDVARIARFRPGGSAGDVDANPAIAVVCVLRPDVDMDPSALWRGLDEQLAEPWELVVMSIGNAERRRTPRKLHSLSHRSMVALRWLACPAGTSVPEARELAFAATVAPLVLPWDPCDVLAPEALAALVEASMAADGIGAVYADEDRVNSAGESVDPRLKPDWSPDFLLSSSYTGRPFAIDRTVLAAAGGLAILTADAWEHDLALRVAETTPKIAHVAEVLCHRVGGALTVEHAGPARSVVCAALARRGESAVVEPTSYTGVWSIRRQLPEPPLVSIIVPFRDQPVLLRTCLETLRATSTEITTDWVLVDNGSSEPETVTLIERLVDSPNVSVVHDDRPFNWAALNNAAARQARGEVLVFVNNDVEARRDGWLSALVAQALRPDVGAVGARLLYPTGRVQHAGVVVGLGGAAGHLLAGLDSQEPGYLGMAVHTRDCSAVTGACLATRRSVFDEFDGFDEALGLDLNDIDYCLRLRDAGLRTVFEPLAELIHHESPSRGTSGSVENITRFIDRWRIMIDAGDPHLHRQLTRVDSSCALRRSDEEVWWRDWHSSLER